MKYGPRKETQDIWVKHSCLRCDREYREEVHFPAAQGVNWLFSVCRKCEKKIF